MGQPLVVDEIDVVGPVRDQALGQPAHAPARQHCPGLHTQPVGQFPGLAAELQGDVVQRALFLLGEDPDFTLSIRFDHPYGSTGSFFLTTLDEKGTWFILCEAPFGPFRQNKPGPFFVHGLPPAATTP